MKISIACIVKLIPGTESMTEWNDYYKFSIAIILVKNVETNDY